MLKHWVRMNQEATIHVLHPVVYVLLSMKTETLSTQLVYQSLRSICYEKDIIYNFSLISRI